MLTSVKIFRKIFLAASCVMLAVSSCLKEEVVITGISLDRQTLNLQLGETAKLNATVLPSSAVEVPIVWSSSNTEVVKVNHGAVTAAGLGKATVIAASSSSGGVTATCEVTVSDNVSGISLDKRELEIYEGNTEVIKATLQTSDSAGKKVQWTSSADSLVEVSDGKIFAKRAPVSGQPVKIEAIVNEDGQNFTDSCMVTVKCHVSSIILNKTEVKMQQGELTKLEVTVLPERATVRDFDFTVSDPQAISFDPETRIVKGLKASPEPAYITFTSRDSVTAGCIPKAICKVTVVKYVEGISIVRDGKTVDTLLLSKYGGAVTLSARFEPDEGVTNKKVNWSSSNENVARIKENGENGVAINPVGAGYATIIATSEDGGKTASCSLRVVVPLEEIAINDDLPSEMYEVEQLRLSIKYKPENATVDFLSWQSSDLATATVSSDGTVTAVRASGSPVKITATAKSFNAAGEIVYLKKECSTIVKCHPTSVKLNSKSEIMKPGETLQLTADVQPERAGDTSVTWISRNSEVVAVDKDGNVTALKVSEQPVYIVVETNDCSLRDSCEIRVVPISVSGITIRLDGKEVKSVSLKKGDTTAFTCILEPGSATDTTVKWESTKPDVATVTDKGVLTAVGGGYTRLKVKSSDGAASAWCKVSVTVPLTGISFDKTSLDMYEHERDTLKVNYEPIDATDTKLEWTSLNDDAVAVIDGRIVALKAGSGPVYITATGTSGNGGKLSQTCKVTVKCHVEAVHLSHKSLSVPAGSQFALSATVCPDRATDKRIKWSSNNNDVATVDANGKVTAIKDGKATITATSVENESISDCCNLTVTNSGPVPVEPESVTLNSTLLSLKEGEIYTLEATVSPSDADKSVTWNSGNSSVATVDDGGKVTAIAAGLAEITATTVNGKTATCTVTVRQEPVGPVDVTSVTLSASPNKVNIGGTLKITATVSPDNATDNSLVWESNNTAVATVDENGNVTGHSVGSAKITATSKNGKSGSIEITVEKAYVPVTGIKIEVDPNDPRYQKGILSLYVGEDFQLNVVISPANATNKDVTWKVVGGHVKVSDGKLTAAVCMSPGDLDFVTVCSVDNPSKERALPVNVKARKATGVALDRSAFSMTVGGSEKLHPVFAPVNTTDQSGKWESDNADVVSVGDDGTVTAKAPGQAKITFTSTDGGFKGYCCITVSSSANVDPGRIQGVGFDDLNGE